MSILVKTSIIDQTEYERQENLRGKIRITLIASVKTAKIAAQNETSLTQCIAAGLSTG